MLAVLAALTLLPQTKPDPSTLLGKVMCGYQGWFSTPGDGQLNRWFHWGPADFGPGRVTVDMWPDMSEATPGEKMKTSFVHADGSPAYVFSSANPLTVDRHFKWMQDYGFDGVFLQRFGSDLRGQEGIARSNKVLSNVENGAKNHGRVWAMMYDLSGLKKGEIGSVIKEDWKALVNNGLLKNRGYLHQNKKPLVAVWGIGFNDNRAYTLEECKSLIDFLKQDSQYGGNAVLVGVPTGWRDQVADSVKDPLLTQICEEADVVSPWTVGRYANLEQVQNHADKFWKPDFEWCQAHHNLYLPVVFPGFSWHNLMKVRGRESKFDQIPRLQGRFLWAQYAALKKIGVPSVYQAMFDEVDEGTAIFKTTNDPPVGASPFLADKSLPSDHYLWLVGQARRMITGQLPYSESMPMSK